MNKVALLFLTRKEFNHPAFWKKMLEGREDQFNIYIHSKEPLDDPFFKKYQISRIVPTSYLMHGEAWQVLIQEALKDSDNQKFVYLSESCIPLYPLDEIYHHLIKDSSSYMRYSVPWWPRDGAREVTEIPLEHRWGNAEWIILNREHAKIIADDQEILKLTSKHINSDHEAYPSSLFSLKNCLNDVVYRVTTYANFKTPTPPHPYHFKDYNQIEQEYIRSAKRSGCLFARKFIAEFPQEKLFEIVKERLMAPPSNILNESLASDLFEEKLKRLQIQEELSQANACALLPMLINEGFFEIGYEIGVGVGLHTERLMKAAYIGKLYGVDDYKRKFYQGIAFEPDEEEMLYQYVQQRIEALELNAELIKASSLDAAKNVPDKSVDLVYFNSETMDLPMEDNLNAWFPKLKDGGIIAGFQYDYFYPRLQPEISQFFFDKKLLIHQEFVEPKFWWVEL